MPMVKVSQPEGDKPGIALDLGEGVTLGTSAKKFNIAVPAGEYHGLSIVLTATNGKKCTINAKKDKAIEIVYNTVNTLAISGEFKLDLPTGALPGVFTVSNDDGVTKTPIFFSPGNLWYGKVGDAQTATFQFEANQYDTTPSSNGSLDATHISHFWWSKTASVAYAESYSESGTAATDVFFTNATAETAKSYFTVNGVTGKYRTLSIAEWQYLFNNHSKKWATVNGVKGYVIAPDGFEGTLSDSYADDAALAAAGNLVFLPAAGGRSGGPGRNPASVGDVGDLGYYWSSTANGKSIAYGVAFNEYTVRTDGPSGRDNGISVRLVTESN